jgi:biopolymer transport protein ExbD
MKLNAKRNDDEIAVDMSPMIDLVFLLLIFFLVASAVIKVEKVPIEVPAAVYAKVPEDETGRFAITVNTEDDLFIGPASDKVTLEQLTDRMRSEVEADPEIRIVIRADRKVKYGTNEKIMEACAEAGANDLIFAAFEE